MEDLQVNHKFSIECAETLASQLGVPFRSYEHVAVTREELEENSTEGLRFYSYRTLGHWIDDQELEDLFAWILFILPDGTADNLNGPRQ